MRNPRRISGARDWLRGGQDGERIRMLKDSADFRIYTPGSDAGIPVSILQSFAAPPLNWDDNAELLRERIQGTVSALLGLVGVEADPIRSREHILLSNLFEHYWRAGEDLDLPKIIMSIQNPPIRQLGVFDIDTMFPEKDRFELSMMLNNIIAAPSFQSWLQGDALDISGFLYTDKGKPRHSIFYIAHLSDAERMFFVTMLLNQLVTWMRTQPGTTSLRALLYMDEVFGFFPPVAEPPSKKPLLTLMKQARAFGVGVMLTTQNPADLDYKGLTNAGTWFIGRLQTERDKARLMEGLESASASATLDRRELDATLSSLGKRVFLLHNVHESEPVTFNTRWAMSYLRGPLTRSQVRTLMKDTVSSALQPAPSASGASVAPSAVAAPVAAVAPRTAPAEQPAPYASTPPTLSGVQQAFLPLRKGGAQAEMELEKRAGTRITVQRRNVLYMPTLLGMGRVHFVKATKDLQVDEAENYALLAQPPEGVGVLRWEQAQSLDMEIRDILDRPENESWFGELPASINDSKDITANKKELADHLYRERSLTLYYSPATKLYADPGESERDFRMRVNQAARELRDEEVDELEDRYKSKLRTLEERPAYC